MAQKPITRKQMRWQVFQHALSAILTGVSFWLVSSWLEKTLTGALFALSVGCLIFTIWQWKKHPLEDEAVDRELKEEQKNVLIASGSMLLFYTFIILFIILAVRAF